MKKILTLIVASMLALSSQSFAKDLGNGIKLDLEAGYAMDGWSANGSDLNSARGAAYLTADIEKNINDQFRIVLENSFFELDDIDTTDGASYSYGHEHKLTVSYLVDNFDIGVFGLVEDKNESVNNENFSYQGLDIGYTVDGTRFGLEYSEDLSGEATTAGGIKYGSDLLTLTAEKTLNIMGKDVDFELMYFDADNLRETISLDAEVMITENVGFGFLVGENDGKGDFANVDSQNRDFASGRVFVKY